MSIISIKILKNRWQIKISVYRQKKEGREVGPVFSKANLLLLGKDN